jgi:uncharacterized protein involved in type VI secretion and phage assembly
VRPQSPRDPASNTRYGSIVYAVVTQNKDPDNLNRIKVRFPWLDEGSTDQSTWAQLATPMEGNKFGWYTVPDVDDVVTIMFLHADMNHPIVLGGVWSKPDHPPEANEDGKNNFRGYRSRAGHRLILDDTAKTKVVVSDMTTDLMVGVGNWDEAGTGPNKCAVLKPKKAGTTGVSISSMKGNVEVTCKKGKLTIDAGKNIYFDIKQGAEMQSGQDFSADCKVAKLTSGGNSTYVGSQVYVGP